MIRAFIDASVLFAASYSKTGASREIIRYALQGKAILIISEFVLDEAERNLSLKHPATLPVFHFLTQTIPFEIIEPTVQEVQDAKSYTAHKDAPVVAAAKKARPGFLVSLDRRHLVDQPEVARRSGLKIVLPEDLLEELRRVVKE
ncbi:MAG: PIN domain-containing protein [Anaerolineae bacterium]|nr:PIN domain-containing protein [Anaerolineae bacterium]